jgi:Peptidase family M1 domain/Carboxypeptidase regulatory-like domain
MSSGEPMSLPDRAYRTPQERKPLPAKSLGRAKQSLLRLFLPRTLIPVLVGLAFAANLRADTISGTVTDPSGAVVVNARIEITGNNLSRPLILMSDESGKFSAPNLTAGKYSVRAAKEGFDELVSTIDLHDTASLELKLTIATQQTSVNVTEKSSGLANSDPGYRQLRDDGLGNTYHCEKFILNLDVGTFELQSGTITVLHAVNNFQTGAIFLGQGHFTLKPLIPIDTQEMVRRVGKPTAEEDFSEVVFRFTPALYLRVAAAFGPRVETPREAAEAWKNWKNKVRRRHEYPEGLTQQLFEQEMIDNVDADLLAAIYNPKHPPFFNAYIVGAHHKDLRFYVRTRVGAIPQIDSPEEVALVNFSGGGMDDGVWYAQHLGPELKARTANSLEDRRLFATRRYNIETVIAKDNHLYSRATVTFEPLVPGERILKFALLLTLRVTRVSDQNGKELHFIQEGKKEDGSFYVLLDEAPEMGKEHSVSIEYVGDKVLYDAGGGSYYVGARQSWYPNLNGFGEKALYDLTFKVPRPNVVISVGNLAGESSEEGFAVSHWVTPVPVAVAGFNYGKYSKIDFPDTITHYKISGYYLAELPDNLKRFQGGGLSGNAPSSDLRANALTSMSPASMTRYALDQTRAQLQVCTLYFGRAPYDHVEITEQPNFSFGQSWPNLVYLPISAYIDSTQRWMLFGHIDAKFTGFVREVTPHEVAHQWFGHSVGWASYHDQWLSEGFAEFAAGLFLQQATGPKWQKDYIDFWERQRVRILEKNSFGISPNDAGPLWLGLRLASPRSESAYQGLTYPKGAYVLQMLRSLMYADQGEGNRDQAFIDMMHDFMQSHHDANASTESFKAIVEKHMPKRLDIQQNGRLDWFFNEWVYGTQVPRYHFKYEVQPGDKGSVKVRAEITQSEVDDNFAMFVPVFADFGQGWVRLGQLALTGNSTRTAIFSMDRQPKKVALNVYKDILER